MSRSAPVLAARVLALATCVAFGTPSRAEDAGAPSAGPRGRVVATVGAKTITAGELEDRLAKVPAFQLAAFGHTPDEVKRGFLEGVLVRELLLVQGAEKRNLASQLPVSHTLTRARSDATLRAVRARVGPASAVPAEAIQRFYQENHARYASPERYHLWRILCQSKDQALAILDAARKDGKLAKFQELAREHSIDKVTYLRGGNLGFVTADGSSNEPGLKVDPALVQAARAVKDGEFVPEPVQEMSGWAVVWRRGTLPATQRSLADVTASIRDMLHKERLERAQGQLIDELRAREVKDVIEGPLENIEVAVDEAALVPRKRPAPNAALSAPSPSSAPSGSGSEAKGGQAPPGAGR